MAPLTLTLKIKLYHLIIAEGIYLLYKSNIHEAWELLGVVGEQY